MSNYPGPSLAQQAAADSPNPNDLVAGYNQSQASIADLNLAADQLVGTSLGRFGSLPDPRMAMEAMSTGAAPDVAAAMSDPSTAALLSSTPLGTTPRQPDGAVPLTKPADWTTMTQQDWANHWKRVKAASGHDAQWKSFGDIPEPNLDYVRAVTRSDASSVRKWQQYFNDSGNYFGDKLKVSGTWDTTTDQAFRLFLLRHFMPDAIWGDTATKNRTTGFLDSLGITPDQLNSKLRDTGFQTQAVADWLSTHGPDVKSRDTLNEFVDKYGEASLPKTLQALRGNFWTNLGDTVVGISHMLSPFSMGADIADWLSGGRVPQGVKDVLDVINPLRIGAGTLLTGASTGHWGLDDLYKSPSQVEADLTAHDLNKAQAAALAPALQEAHDSSGYLGFLDTWDRTRTKAVLGVSYYFGDAFAGKNGGWSQNPFDSGSAANRGAEAHKDNLAAGFFGDKFAHDHPWLAVPLNVTANIADDPISYLPMVGLDAKVELSASNAARLAETVGEQEALRQAIKVRPALRLRGSNAAYRAAALSPSTISDAIKDNRVTSHILTSLISPRSAALQDLAKLIRKPGLHAADIADILRLEGAEGEKLLDGLVPAVLNAKSDAEALGLLHDEIGEQLHGVDWLFNAQEARKRLTVDVFTRLSRGKQIHLLSSGIRGMMDRSATEMTDSRLELMRSLADKGATIGATPDEMREVLDLAKSTEPRQREQAVLKFRDLEETALKRLFTAKNLSWSEFLRHVSILRGYGDHIAAGDPLPKKVAAGADKTMEQAVAEGATAAEADPTLRERLGAARDAVVSKAGSIAPRADRPVEQDERRYAYLPGRQSSASRNVIELSRMRTKAEFHTGDPARDAMLNEHAEEIRQSILHMGNRLSQMREGMLDDAMHGGPATAEARDAALRHIEDSPEMAQEAAWSQRQIDMLNEEMDRLLAENKHRGIEGEHPVAATSGQFNIWARTRFTPYEVLSYITPGLRKAEWLQAKMHLDQVTGMWKRIVLMKLSSTLKIALGDESSRAAIDRALDGGPQAFAKFVTRVIKRDKDTRKLPDTLTQGVHDMLQGLHHSDFIVFEPGTQGYVAALRHFVERLHGPTPEAKVWTQAIKDAQATQEWQRFPRLDPANVPLEVSRLEEWLRGDSPEAAEFRRREKLEPDAPQIRTLARTLDQNFKYLTKYDPKRQDGKVLFDMLDHAANGRKGIDRKRFENFVAQHASDETYLPLVSGRRPYGEATSLVGRRFNQMSEKFQHAFTDRAVNNQRQWAYRLKLDQYEAVVKKFHPEWEQERVEARAQMWAATWVRKNTYQGQRTVMATAMRNAFPFWGATANFNRFILRQYAKHPWTIKPSMKLLDSIQQAQTQGGIHIPMPGSGALLRMFGANSGDDLMFNPLHAFFFTSEGYGGMIPGLGPFLNMPLKLWAGENPDVSDALKKIPGFEFVDVNSPLAAWGQKFVDGISLKLTGNPFLANIPLIGKPGGTYQQQILKAEQQQHAQYLSGERTTDTTAESAAQQVGGADLLTGILSEALPISPQVVDPVQAKINPALQAWDTATSDKQRDQVKALFPDAKPLLDYYDPRSNEDDRRAIVRDFPWVAARGTGITASGAAGVTAGTEPTRQLYMQDLARGRLRYLTSDEYIGKLQKNDEYNDAWGQWETVHTSYNDYLLANGLAPNSAQAKTFRANYLEPAIMQIGDTHPNWRNVFNRGLSTDPSGLKEASQPLYSLMTWEVIPHAGEAETPTTRVWRQVKVDMDYAATTIRELKSLRRPQVEQQAVVDGLVQRIDAYSQLDESFASQIRQFSYKQVQDLIDLEAEGMA